MEHKSPLRNRAWQSNEKSKQMFQLSVCLLEPLRQLDGLFYVFSSIGLITSYYDEYFLFCTINYFMEKFKNALYIIFSSSKQRINLEWLDFIPVWDICGFLWKEKSELVKRKRTNLGLISEVTVKLQMERITISTPKPLPVFLWSPLNRWAISKLASEAVTPRTFLWIDA